MPLTDSVAAHARCRPMPHQFQTIRHDSTGKWSVLTTVRPTKFVSKTTEVHFVVGVDFEGSLPDGEDHQRTINAETAPRA